MDSKKYFMGNYVPFNPIKSSDTCYYARDLNTTLLKMKYEKIVNDPEYHFENCNIINFDLIHNECRGDKLDHSRKHYETIFKKKLNNEITNDNDKNNFISCAIKCEREDVFFEKGFFKEYFNRTEIEKKLEKQGIFLSAMKKKFYRKKTTDDCKSLMY